MNPAEKQGPGIHVGGDLTRRENDLLLLGAKKDKRESWAQVRWLIEAYGLGLLKFTEDGAEARKLLRVNEAEVHYPDSVSVSTSRVADKE